MLRKRISTHAGSRTLQPAMNNMIKESTCTCNTQGISEYDYKICTNDVVKCITDTNLCPDESVEICTSHEQCPSNCSCNTVAKCIAEVVTCPSVCKPQNAAYYYHAYNPGLSSWGKYSAISSLTLCNNDCNDTLCKDCGKDLCLDSCLDSSGSCLLDSPAPCSTDLCVDSSASCPEDSSTSCGLADSILCATDSGICRALICSCERVDAE